MAIRAYDEEFLDFVKSRTTVTLQELQERFGDDTDFLLRNHNEGGYIAVDGDVVRYLRDDLK